MDLFQSKKFIARLNDTKLDEQDLLEKENINIQDIQDPIEDIIGFARTVLNPKFRQDQIRRNPLYEEKKKLIKKSLIQEAEIGFEKDFRRGRFSIGNSPLASPFKQPRRSKRIQARIRKQ